MHILHSLNGSCTERLNLHFPLHVQGMTGWAGLVGYALYNIKNRKTSLSLYLIHTRVTAQVLAIGCMVSVVGYNIFKHEKKKYYATKETNSLKSDDKDS